VTPLVLPDRDHHPLWRFSLRVYRAPGAEAACLALQDGYGTDTNLLLYCCWLGRAGRSVDKRSLRATMALVERWQAEVIQPLRQARRALKTMPLDAPGDALHELRKRLGAIELELEYVEQCQLLGQAGRLPGAARKRLPDAAMHDNVRRYVELLAIPAASPAWQHLRCLIDASRAIVAQG